MRSPVSLRLAWAHVRAGYGRMILTTIAIALGVAFVVSTTLTNDAILRSFVDVIDALAGMANLSITAGEDLTFPEDVLDQVEKVPGVALAVPLVRGVAFPVDGRGELLTVLGVDLTRDSYVRLYTDEASNTTVDDS